VDWLTAAAIGLIAMCVVTCDHEALGHGSACLLLGGRIQTLTSSIFRCDVRSGWIDPAGPVVNLLAGTLALILFRLVPARFAGMKFFFVAVTAMSFFWEGAYTPYAMARQSGDLYFFAQFIFQEVSPIVRVAFAAGGVALYIFAVRWTSRALLELWSNPAIARPIARAIWIAATLGAGLAALVYRGEAQGDLRDAVLEIGVASLPLLFIPSGRTMEVAGRSAPLPRSYVTIAIAVIVFALFAATLGRGVSMT